MQIATTQQLRATGVVAALVSVALAVPTVSMADKASDQVPREPVSDCTDSGCASIPATNLVTTTFLLPSLEPTSPQFIPRPTTPRPEITDLQRPTTPVTSPPPVISSRPEVTTTPVTTTPPVISEPPIVTTTPPIVTTTPPIITDPPIVTTEPPIVTTTPPIIVTTTPPTVTYPPTVTTTPSADVPPTQTAVATPAALELSAATVDPGGQLTATGTGCAPNEVVLLAIEQVAVGTAVAEADGHFEAALDTGSVDIGRHQVIARCGPTLAAPLDILLVNHVGTGTTTVTLILIFLILGVWFYAHRLISHLPERRNRD